MPFFDFKCESCQHVTGEIVKAYTMEVACEECGDSAVRIYEDCAKTLTTIIPAYKGSLKQKAGYVHSHGDRPATKTQGKGWSKD